ncbi:hypothetical protein RDI58_012605 [Solanum bulbocastanum]|uniref:Uncharacterized protein n=1 Tax=Solanum bulbocastanum TaxID=147425 RepID=A0AAN8TP33_SOLBU
MGLTGGSIEKSKANVGFITKFENDSIRLDEIITKSNTKGESSSTKKTKAKAIDSISDQSKSSENIVCGLVELDGSEEVKVYV